MIKSAADKFQQFEEFHRRVETIKALMANEHSTIVKEALERELARSIEMMDDALSEGIRRSMQEAHHPWVMPAGTGRAPFGDKIHVVNMTNQKTRHSDPEQDKRIFDILRRVDLSKVIASTLREEDKGSDGDCLKCDHLNSCHPECAERVAKVDDSEHPEVVAIPPHLMERVLKLMDWASHDTQEITELALGEYLKKRGY